ncbi:LysR family transcriptional regulator [uncultured Cohaesibacter sp.]|uniref:LysR family transcriptional regulator n=1 Tax=uncultured Cohaesibacter sp. TaxID=1002546 RepID=UPI0029C66487|nr:LysR family transcriptional regulator [uncultured Cohaesibacter sp.]
MKRGRTKLLARISLGKRVPMTALIQTLAVAEYLSFQGAARALGVSQSSVSMRVRDLEQELGILLFERSTHGVQPTEAGRHFVAEVDSALETLEAAILCAGSRARGEKADLRVGIYSLVPGGFLDRLFKRFKEEVPLVHFEISEGTAREALFMLREGKLDIAFMACNQEIPDLHSRTIWSDEILVGLPLGHPLTTQKQITWKDLAQQTFLTRRGGTGPQIHDLIIARSMGRWPIPEILKLKIGYGTLLSLIEAGCGISLFLKEASLLRARDVVFKPIHDETERITFSVVWSPNNHNPALSRLLKLAMDMDSDKTDP